MKKASIFTLFLFYTICFAQNDTDTLKVKNIETVTVEGKKKLVEQKIDRLVYNVENSMVSQGSSGIEVLTNTPLLKLDEDKGILSIVGKNKISVMVNDRMLNLSGNELLAYLKNLRSENIAKIEVITTPPAKYDAQGNSGIINIILKKKQKMGWTGYLNSYYKQSTWGGFGGAAGINYQDEKLKSSIKFRGYDEQKKSVENYSIKGKNSSISRDERLDMNDGLGVNLSMEYAFNEKSNMGFIYDFGKGHSNMDINSTARYFTNALNTLNTDTDSKHRSDINSQMLNLFYDYKFKDHKLSFGVNYYGNIPDTQVNFTTTNLATESEETVRSLSSVDYKIYSGQADLALNLKKLPIEIGLKYSQFSNNSDIGYYNFINYDYILEPERSNLFNYDEKNYAAYVSASKNFNDKWSAKLGLRYEYSDIKGISPYKSSQSQNSYGKLFPTFYVSYKLNSNNQFSINYSKRIDRPYFRALDPFRWYSNPNSYSAGNPSLQPSFSHNIELNYIFKNKLSANLFFQKSLDNYDQITILNGINQISTYENYYNQNNYGINLNYSDTFFKFWETNLSTSFSYSETKITKFNATAQNGQSFYYSTNNTFQLNNQKTLFLFLNYWQSLPSKAGNSFSQTNASLNAGIKMSLMEKSLQINLSVNDIFRQAGGRATLYFTDNTQYFNNYWDARKLTLSITYTIGNHKIKTSDRKINFEEKNRAQ